MPNIRQFRVVHNGYTGAPGYTQFYFDAAGVLADQIAQVGNFWQTVGPLMCQGWTATIESDVPVLNDSTGALVSVSGTTPPTISAAGATGAFAGGVGAVAGWTCNEVHGSKRLRGRTFVVPLSGSAYESNGTLTSSALTTIRGAAATMITSAVDFGVWGRPVDGLNGLFGLAVSSAVRDKTAILRTRRD